MSERLENWIAATRASVTAALASPSDTERLLEAFCAIDALASITALLNGADATSDAASSEAAMAVLEPHDPVAWLALSASERRALIARGKLAIGPARPAPEEEDDDALAQRLVRAAAQRGLARLTGAVSHDDAAPRIVRGERVPERTLLRLVRGELDGFHAQSIARRIAASTESGLELRLLLGLPDGADAQFTQPQLLRLAADGPAEVRDPSTGKPAGSSRVVTSDGPLELEAVRFDDGVLGIYASRAVPLVLADARDGFSVRGSAPGYLELDASEHTEVAMRVEDRDVTLKLKGKRK